MGLFGSYTTQLNDAQEAAYQQWKARLPPNLQNEADYDLRGAFQANSQQAANGHLPDTYKKPNHMTFSDESQYSTPQMPGGHWSDAGNDKWAFWASPTNIQQHPINEIARYFREAEPDSTFIAPSNWSLRNAPRKRR